MNPGAKNSATVLKQNRRPRIGWIPLLSLRMSLRRDLLGSVMRYIPIAVASFQAREVREVCVELLNFIIHKILKKSRICAVEM